ncbi:archaeosortase/exosortase family protein [Sulfurirhabdus autotrophica]|uniref:Exosortase family protein XrtM n=1 Tax=Sulfurirhabdus autotrophica TaxID=1706046 RepID=A0A4R3Y9D8_9PROT|nr:archaeosortase/exosortase family protein [Sulfurirhabdus autotrophica]TCV88211.1 exosortase family protein XrtM [Sulfurirhabdus autotrophica]
MALNNLLNPVMHRVERPRMFARELRFALLFLLAFFLLQYGYSASRGTAFEHLVIDVATVRPSAAMINLIAPKEQAQATGHRIVSPLGGLSILNGCEGTESIFLLLAAIVAFSAPWKHKLRGALLGTVFIYLLNQGRIVSLYFAAHYNRHWFDLLHGTIAPTLIIVLGCVFFLWWASRDAAVGNEPAYPA